MEKELCIVLPFHNSEKFLLKTLNSLLSQTYSDFRLILINDNSSDNSLNIISSINDSRVNIIKNEGKGAVAAYNTGIKNADSEFIFIADHDDLFDSQLIEKEYKLLTNNIDISIVSSSYYVMNEIDEVIHKVTLPSKDANIREIMKYQCSINNSGSMIRKSVFEQYGGFDNHFFPAHDYEFYIRIMDCIYFYNIPEFLIKWRSVSYSPSQKQFKLQREKSLEALKNYFNKILLAKQIPKGKYFFLIGRSLYYHKSIFKSKSYFIKAFLFGNRSNKNLFFFFKSFFLWFPIKFYRDWLAKNKFNKDYRYDF